MIYRRWRLNWVPAEAETYLPAVCAEEVWVPACAGTYCGDAGARRA